MCFCEEQNVARCVVLLARATRQTFSELLCICGVWRQHIRIHPLIRPTRTLQQELLHPVYSPGHRISSTYLVVVLGNYGKHKVRHFWLWCVYDVQSLIKLLAHQGRRNRNERERRVLVLGFCPQLCLQLDPQTTTEGQHCAPLPNCSIQDCVQQGMLTQRN